MRHYLLTKNTMKTALLSAMSVFCFSSATSAQVIWTVDGNEAADQADEKLDKILKAINDSDKDKYKSKADTWLFFEGNHCAEQLVGSLHKAAYGHESVNAKKSKFSWFENDEARSVLIQGPALIGEFLQVCDHPTDCKKDDSATILLKRGLGEGDYMCIGTFQQENYEDSHVKIDFQDDSDGKLDGKVSRVINYDVCAKVRNNTSLSWMKKTKCPSDFD